VKDEEVERGGMADVSRDARELRVKLDSETAEKQPIPDAPPQVTR
jgi:hypothetical protein